MNDAGFEVLVNENFKIEFKNRTLNIFGADEVMIGYFNAEKTMTNINENEYNLLIMHEPDLADEFMYYSIDLILSGHSHGGQVSIPFYGPLVKNAYSEKYTKGFYKLDNNRNTQLYVNTGLGNTKLPFRFGNIPQISEFTIRL